MGSNIKKVLASLLTGDGNGNVQVFDLDSEQVRKEPVASASR